MKTPSTAYDHTPILRKEPPPGWDADDLLDNDRVERTHERASAWQILRRVTLLILALAALWYFWAWFGGLIWNTGHVVVSALVNA